MSEPWNRMGLTVYALEHAGWKRGDELVRNRWSFHVQAGPETTEKECEVIAALAQSAPDLLEALKTMCTDGEWITVEGKMRWCVSSAAIERGAVEWTKAEVTGNDPRPEGN